MATLATCSSGPHAVAASGLHRTIRTDSEWLPPARLVRPHSGAVRRARPIQCCSSVLSSTGTMVRLWRSRKSWQLFVSVRSASRTIRRDCSAGSLRGKQRDRRCCSLTCGAHLWLEQGRPSLARSVLHTWRGVPCRISALCLTSRPQISSCFRPAFKSNVSRHATLFVAYEGCTDRQSLMPEHGCDGRGHSGAESTNRKCPPGLLPLSKSAAGATECRRVPRVNPTVRSAALHCSAAHAQVSAQIMHKGCAAQAAGILIEGSVLILDGPAVYDRYGPALVPVLVALPVLHCALLLPESPSDLADRAPSGFADESCMPSCGTMRRSQRIALLQRCRGRVVRRDRIRAQPGRPGFRKRIGYAVIHQIGVFMPLFVQRRHFDYVAADNAAAYFAYLTRVSCRSA
jgi:hypothetical protein